MKKIISIILAALFVFTLCACGEKDEPQSTSSEHSDVSDVTESESNPTESKGETSPASQTASESGGESKVIPTNNKIYMPERTFNKTAGTAWNLDNTYRKLTADKNLTVAYIGGSVTVGTGADYKTEAWRALTTKWLQTEFGANVTEINASVGGSSALWALGRLQKAVIDKKPDLLFIEFSVNDNYCDFTYAQSAALMEGIVKKVNAALPNCDIVIVTVVDKKTIESPSVNAQAHRDFAKYSGITWLDMTVPFREALKTQKWADIVTDTVHPNKTGYKIYADYITGELGKMLNESKSRNPGKITAHTLPAKTFTSNSALYSKTAFGEDIQIGDGWKKRDTKTGDGGSQLIRGQKGAVLNYEFSGTLIGIKGTIKKGANLDITIDGANLKQLAYESEETEELLYDNLNPKEKHTLTITVTGTNLCEINAIIVG